MKKKSKPMTNKTDPSSYKKHRGNPHGNAPSQGSNSHVSSSTSDDKLREIPTDNKG
jgi:hypothetical protein